MTLTATIGIKEDTQTTTALHYSGRLFIPTSNFDTTHSAVATKASSPSPTTYDARAFVHYDPTRSCLALGADPDSSQTQAIWLSLERYTWLISQLHEEQNVYTFLKNCSIGVSATHGLSGQQQQQQSYRQSAPPPPSSGSCLSSSSPSVSWYPFLCTPSPLLGVLNPRCNNTTSLSRRLSRFVHRGNSKQQYNLPPSNEIYLFMIPKALLLQAAAYIPMTKPLPPMYSSSNCPSANKSPLPEKLTKQQPTTPFTKLSMGNTQRLKRYVQLLTLTAHDLMATPAESTDEDTTLACHQMPSQYHQTTMAYDLICGRCGINTSLGTMTSANSALSATAAMEASQSLTTQNGTEIMEDSKDEEQQQRMPAISVSKTLTDKKLVMDPTFNITYFQPILNTSTESAHLYGTPRPYSHSPLPISSTKKDREGTPTFNTFPKRQQHQSLTSGIHHDSIDHLSCTDSVSTSGVTSGSFSLTYQKTSGDDCGTGISERKGYLAIDP
ncbi:hypothetical protein BCR42DRAFT_245279 [Absidia repens]|uniref:Uncharacterized protein n=1 Tax=Absidia repens TaxID=90262 RepID=A0A1X2IKM2_9FUNG|nr:hypothetical protein BCR42DRAFT_245279 [Absidia repens]